MGKGTIPTTLGKVRICANLLLLSFALLSQSGCWQQRAFQDQTNTEVRSSDRRIDHSPFTSCVTCHNKDRPAPDHNKDRECVVCHNPGTRWLDLKAYTHNPKPASCSRCHEADRPVFRSGVFHADGRDCVTCHTAGTEWSDLIAWSHVPTPSSCASCHEGTRPVSTNGHFETLDCGQCHLAKSATQPQFSFKHKGYSGSFVSTCLPCHEARRKSPDHYRGRDCSECHLTPLKPWLDSIASPHVPNNPVPNSCSGCHERNRPKGHFAATDCKDCHNPKGGAVTAFVFDHFANGLARTTCLPCHESKRPRTVVQGFSHDAGGTGDCITCHTKPGEVWSGAVFGHVGKIDSCQTCHEEARPAALVKNFLHSIAATRDCSDCHGKPGVTWEDGTFDHLPSLTACALCHESDRPATLVKQFVHPLVPATRDCAECHKTPGVSWADGRYDHQSTPSSCAACHDSIRPTEVVANFSHQAVETAECGNCHKSPGVSWSDGLFNHSPAPAVCANCHQSDRPQTHTQFADGDCASCHAKPGITWADSKDRACTECHADKVSGTAASSHPVDPTSIESIRASCKVCHDLSEHIQKVKIIGGNGSLFVLDPSNADQATAACMSCHSGHGNLLGNKIPPTIGTYSSAQDGDFHGGRSGSGFGGTLSTPYQRAQEALPCLDCHAVHTSNNAFLFAPVVLGKAIPALSIARSGTGAEKLCQSCHLGQWHQGCVNCHGYNPQPAGSACFGCHGHEGIVNFQMSACDSCHDGGAPPRTMALPKITSQVSVLDVTASSAKVVWNTDQPTTTYVAYGMGSSTQVVGRYAQDYRHEVVLTGLTENSTYVLRARSANVIRGVVESPPVTFITARASGPSVPALVPQQGSYVACGEPVDASTLQWNASTSSSGNPLQYRLVVSLARDFVTSFLDTGWISETSFSSVFPYNRTYYWRVMSRDPGLGHSSPWSNMGVFASSCYDPYDDY